MQETKYQVGDLIENIISGEIYLVEEIRQYHDPKIEKHRYVIRMISKDFQHVVGSSIIERDQIYRKVA